MRNLIYIAIFATFFGCAKNDKTTENKNPDGSVRISSLSDLKSESYSTTPATCVATVSGSTSPAQLLIAETCGAYNYNYILKCVDSGHSCEADNMPLTKYKSIAAISDDFGQITLLVYDDQGRLDRSRTYLRTKPKAAGKEIQPKLD